jgi:AcrR family transcriptional regulator
VNTRERILTSGAELFRRQGYEATGVKQIVEAAAAPFGSLYHFFPGGKEQLAAEAVRRSGALYGELLPAVFDPAPDAVSGVEAFFGGAAAQLQASDYVDACPIATVALEVSSTSETLRQACADVFNDWITAGTERFEAAGLAPAQAREFTLAMIAGLEGAFVLARALRSTEPLLAAGTHAADSLRRVLAGAATPPAAARRRARSH